MSDSDKVMSPAAERAAAEYASMVRNFGKANADAILLDELNSNAAYNEYARQQAGADFVSNNDMGAPMYGAGTLGGILGTNRAVIDQHAADDLPISNRIGKGITNILTGAVQNAASTAIGMYKYSPLNAFRYGVQEYRQLNSESNLEDAYKNLRLAQYDLSVAQEEYNRAVADKSDTLTPAGSIRAGISLEAREQVDQNVAAAANKLAKAEQAVKDAQNEYDIAVSDYSNVTDTANFLDPEALQNGVNAVAERINESVKTDAEKQSDMYFNTVKNFRKANSEALYAARQKAMPDREISNGLAYFSDRAGDFFADLSDNPNALENTLTTGVGQVLGSLGGAGLVKKGLEKFAGVSSNLLAAFLSSAPAEGIGSSAELQKKIEALPDEVFLSDPNARFAVEERIRKGVPRDLAIKRTKQEFAAVAANKEFPLQGIIAGALDAFADLPIMNKLMPDTSATTLRNAAEFGQKVRNIDAENAAKAVNKTDVSEPKVQDTTVSDAKVNDVAEDIASSNAKTKKKDTFFDDENITQKATYNLKQKSPDSLSELDTAKNKDLYDKNTSYSSESDNSLSISTKDSKLTNSELESQYLSDYAKSYQDLVSKAKKQDNTTKLDSYGDYKVSERLDEPKSAPGKEVNQEDLSFKAEKPVDEPNKGFIDNYLDTTKQFIDKHNVKDKAIVAAAGSKNTAVNGATSSLSNTSNPATTAARTGNEASKFKKLAKALNLGGTVSGAVREGITEFLQGGSESITQGIMEKSHGNPNKNIWEDSGYNAAESLVSAGLGHAVVHGTVQGLSGLKEGAATAADAAVKHAENRRLAKNAKAVQERGSGSDTTISNEDAEKAKKFFSDEVQAKAMKATTSDGRVSRSMLKNMGLDDETIEKIISRGNLKEDSEDNILKAKKEEQDRIDNQVATDYSYRQTIYPYDDKSPAKKLLGKDATTPLDTTINILENENIDDLISSAKKGNKAALLKVNTVLRLNTLATRKNTNKYEGYTPEDFDVDIIKKEQLKKAKELQSDRFTKNAENYERLSSLRTNKKYSEKIAKITEAFGREYTTSEDQRAKIFNTNVAYMTSPEAANKLSGLSSYELVRNVEGLNLIARALYKNNISLGSKKADKAVAHFVAYTTDLAKTISRANDSAKSDKSDVGTVNQDVIANQRYYRDDKSKGKALWSLYDYAMDTVRAVTKLAEGKSAGLADLNNTVFYLNKFKESQENKLAAIYNYRTSDDEIRNTYSVENNKVLIPFNAYSKENKKFYKTTVKANYSPNLFKQSTSKLERAISFEIDEINKLLNSVMDLRKELLSNFDNNLGVTVAEPDIDESVTEEEDSVDSTTNTNTDTNTNDDFDVQDLGIDFGDITNTDSTPTVEQSVPEPEKKEDTKTTEQSVSDNDIDFGDIKSTDYYSTDNSVPTQYDSDAIDVSDLGMPENTSAQNMIDSIKPDTDTTTVDNSNNVPEVNAPAVTQNVTQQQQQQPQQSNTTVITNTSTPASVQNVQPQQTTKKQVAKKPKKVKKSAKDLVNAFNNSLKEAKEKAEKQGIDTDIVEDNIDVFAANVDPSDVSEDYYDYFGISLRSVAGKNINTNTWENLNKKYLASTYNNLFNLVDYSSTQPYKLASPLYIGASVSDILLPTKFNVFNANFVSSNFLVKKQAAKRYSYSSNDAVEHVLTHETMNNDTYKNKSSLLLNYFKETVTPTLGRELNKILNTLYKNGFGLSKFHTDLLFRQPNETKIDLNNPIYVQTPFSVFNKTEQFGLLSFLREEDGKIGMSVETKKKVTTLALTAAAIAAQYKATTADRNKLKKDEALTDYDYSGEIPSNQMISSLNRAVKTIFNITPANSTLIPNEIIESMSLLGLSVAVNSGLINAREEYVGYNPETREEIRFDTPAEAFNSGFTTPYKEVNYSYPDSSKLFNYYAKTHGYSATSKEYFSDRDLVNNFISDLGKSYLYILTDTVHDEKLIENSEYNVPQIIGEAPEKVNPKLLNETLPLNELQKEAAIAASNTPYYYNETMSSLFLNEELTGAIQEFLGDEDQLAAYNLSDKFVNILPKRFTSSLTSRAKTFEDDIQYLKNADKAFSEEAIKQGVAVSEIGKYYKTNVQRVGRMQILDAQNPVGHKKFRSIFTPYKPVTIDLNDVSQRRRAELAILFASGVSIDKAPIEKLQEAFNSAVDLVIPYAGESDKLIHTPSMFKEFLQKLKDYGWSNTTEGIQGALDLIDYVYAVHTNEPSIQFNTSMEIDGVTNGPANALSNYIFNTDQGDVSLVDACAAIGVTLGGVSTNNQLKSVDGKKDIYTIAATGVKNTLQDLISSLHEYSDTNNLSERKLGKQKYALAVKDVFETLTDLAFVDPIDPELSDIEFESDTNGIVKAVKNVLRNATKTPVTALSYGSSRMGLTQGMVNHTETWLVNHVGRSLIGSEILRQTLLRLIKSNPDVESLFNDLFVFDKNGLAKVYIDASMLANINSPEKAELLIRVLLKEFKGINSDYTNLSDEEMNIFNEMLNKRDKNVKRIISLAAAMSGLLDVRQVLDFDSRIITDRVMNVVNNYEFIKNNVLTRDNVFRSGRLVDTTLSTLLNVNKATVFTEITPNLFSYDDKDFYSRVRNISELLDNFKLGPRNEEEEQTFNLESRNKEGLSRRPSIDVDTDYIITKDVDSILSTYHTPDVNDTNTFYNLPFRLRKPNVVKTVGNKASIMFASQDDAAFTINNNFNLRVNLYSFFDNNYAYIIEEEGTKAFGNDVKTVASILQDVSDLTNIAAKGIVLYLNKLLANQWGKVEGRNGNSKNPVANSFLDRRSKSRKQNKNLLTDEDKALVLYSELNGDKISKEDYILKKILKGELPTNINISAEEKEILKRALPNIATGSYEYEEAAHISTTKGVVKNSKDQKGQRKTINLGDIAKYKTTDSPLQSSTRQYLKISDQPVRILSRNLLNIGETKVMAKAILRAFSKNTGLLNIFDGAETDALYAPENARFMNEEAAKLWIYNNNIAVFADKFKAVKRAINLINKKLSDPNFVGEDSSLIEAIENFRADLAAFEDKISKKEKFELTVYDLEEIALKNRAVQRALGFLGYSVEQYAGAFEYLGDPSIVPSIGLVKEGYRFSEEVYTDLLNKIVSDLYKQYKSAIDEAKKNSKYDNNTVNLNSFNTDELLTGITDKYFDNLNNELNNSQSILGIKLDAPTTKPVVNNTVTTVTPTTPNIPTVTLTTEDTAKAINENKPVIFTAANAETLSNLLAKNALPPVENFIKSLKANISVYTAYGSGNSNLFRVTKNMSESEKEVVKLAENTARISKQLLRLLNNRVGTAMWSSYHDLFKNKSLNPKVMYVPTIEELPQFSYFDENPINKSIPAFYLTKERTIVVIGENFNKLSTEEKESIITHELLHNFTIRALDKYTESNINNPYINFFKALYSKVEGNSNPNINSLSEFVANIHKTFFENSLTEEESKDTLTKLEKEYQKLGLALDGNINSLIVATQSDATTNYKLLLQKLILTQLQQIMLFNEKLTDNEDYTANTATISPYTPPQDKRIKDAIERARESGFLFDPITFSSTLTTALYAVKNKPSFLKEIDNNYSAILNTVKKLTNSDYQRDWIINHDLVPNVPDNIFILALTVSTPELREAMSIIDSPSYKDSYESTSSKVDNLISDLGNYALDKLSGSKKTSLAISVDDAISLAHNTNFPFYASFERIENTLATTAEKINDITLKGISSMMRAVSKITKNDSLENIRALIDTPEGLLQLVNKGFNLNMSGAIGSIIKDISGRSGVTDAIYTLLKVSKSDIQRIRQTYRVAVPRVVTDKFKGLSKKEWNTFNKFFNSVKFSKGIDYKELLNMSDRDIQSLINSKEKELTDMIDQYYISESTKKIGREEVFKYIKNKSNNKFNPYKNSIAAANAILRYSKPRPVTQETIDISYIIDDIISLSSALTVKNNDTKAWDTMRSIVRRYKKGVDYVQTVMFNLKDEEIKRAQGTAAIYNADFGALPLKPKNNNFVKLVPLKELDNYKKLGYKKLRLYDTTNFINNSGYTTDKLEKMVWISRDFNPNAFFEQGAIQIITPSIGGVDETTGKNIYINGGYFDKNFADRFKTIYMLGGYSTEGKDKLRPLFDANGKVQALERVMPDDGLKRFEFETDFPTLLGMKAGSIVESDLAKVLNKSIFNNLVKMWRDTTKIVDQKAFIDLNKSNDPIVKEAISMFPPYLKEMIKESFPDGKFMVRKDLVNDVIGERQASVGDLWTGKSRWSPRTQKIFRRYLEALLGENAYAKAVKTEQVLQTTSATLRDLIVVKSMVIPAMNAASSFQQLLMRGVPAGFAVSNIKNKIAEIETYVRLSRKIIELDAQKVGLPKEKHGIFDRKIASHIAAIESLSIYPLIQRGEFASIADVGTKVDDLEFGKTNYVTWLENKIDTIPNKVLRDIVRYGFISHNTALYQGLMKTVQYTDFVARAIYLDYLTKKKKMPKQEALQLISDEFVDYDRHAGRTRGYLENIGLLWFYNYKLRSVKTALSIIKHNPFYALIESLLPAYGSGIGDPLSDNMVSSLLDGKAFNSVGPTLGLQGVFSHPTVDLLGVNNF